MAASTSVGLARTNAANAIATWAGALQAAIDAGGFVLVADTGDTDFTTLTTPGGASTVSGYRIYRSDDATGLLNNFYFKVEVGSGAAANNPSIWWTFGWGSDGAGTITNTHGGSVSSRIQMTLAASTAQDSYFSASTGHFSIGMWAAATSNIFIMSVERTRDTAGAVQDEIFPYLLYSGSGALLLNQVIPRTTGIATNNTTASGSMGSGWNYILSTHATYGANKGLSMLFPMKGAALLPSLNLYGGDTADFASVALTYTLNAYGATHTYIAIGGTANTIPGPNQRCLMRYE